NGYCYTHMCFSEIVLISGTKLSVTYLLGRLLVLFLDAALILGTRCGISILIAILCNNSIISANPINKIPEISLLPPQYRKIIQPLSLPSLPSTKPMMKLRIIIIFPSAFKILAILLTNRYSPLCITNDL